MKQLFKFRWNVFSAAVCVAFLLTACGGDGTSARDARNAGPSPTPSEAVLDPVELGKVVYQHNCLRCHKADGSGGEVQIDGKIISAADLRPKNGAVMPDDQMIVKIMDGSPKGMPAFAKKLRESDLRDVVAYIREEIQH